MARRQEPAYIVGPKFDAALEWSAVGVVFATIGMLGWNLWFR